MSGGLKMDDGLLPPLERITQQQILPLENSTNIDYPIEDLQTQMNKPKTQIIKMGSGYIRREIQIYNL